MKLFTKSLFIDREIPPHAGWQRIADRTAPVTCFGYDGEIEGGMKKKKIVKQKTSKIKLVSKL